MYFLLLLALVSGGFSSFTLATTAPPTSSILHSLDSAAHTLHFTLTRRGGKFAPTEFARDYVNLTYLAQELEKTEARFNLTRREVRGNKLIRKAKSDGALMGAVAVDGIWFSPILFNISILGRVR